MLAAAVFAWSNHPSIWEGWRPASCLPDRCFCEAIRSRLVQQPVNTISSLAFVGVAVLVWLSARASAGIGRFHSRRVYAVLYGSALLVIGLGSAFYHASLSFIGQSVDVLGMYLIATFIVIYNLGRVRSLSTLAAAFGYVVGNAALLAGLVWFPAARRYVFGLLVLLGLALELRARRVEEAARERRSITIALVILFAGFAIWTLDITRQLCAPQSLLQGHAVWHLAGAAAAWFMYLHLSQPEQGPISLGKR